MNTEGKRWDHHPIPRNSPARTGGQNNRVCTLSSFPPSHKCLLCCHQAVLQQNSLLGVALVVQFRPK